MEDTPVEHAILSPRPRDWGSYLAHAPVATSAFMDRVDDLPVQDRRPGNAAEFGRVRTQKIENWTIPVRRPK